MLFKPRRYIPAIIINFPIYSIGYTLFNLPLENLALLLLYNQEKSREC